VPGELEDGTVQNVVGQKVHDTNILDKSWDKSLPYAEFSYNNRCQESLKMAPFKML
jgi:hypothetical protein